jgi:hypothetical protein
MCELTHGIAGERHGRGMGTAWARHGMCESTLSQGSSCCLVPELQFSVRPAAEDKCAGDVRQKFVGLESCQTKLSGL